MLRTLPRAARLVVFVATLVRGGNLHSQGASTGAIRGTVFDPDGRPVAAATVAIVSTTTGLSHSSFTDADGHFAIELLPPGDYSARAEIKGMSPQVSPQIHVDVGGTVELQFRLSLAGASETVTVSGAPPLVETVPSSVSTVIDEKAMNDLPLNGRRFTDLSLLAPGGHAGSSGPDLRLKRGSRLRRHSGLPVQLPGRRRRQQQRILFASPRTLPRTLPVL